ncbi:30S ribosomal protein S12 methylthiotransferase RimO [candidate division KSB1 bacterium]|nr:30S ribosomal protein S12 methylthiotransferase RimO [candidate division KSB1 bacterium]
MNKRHCTNSLRPKRVTIHTLGCAKNTVDSETFAGLLRAAGFEYVTQPHRADVVIVNTCGFLDDAKIESIETMLEAARWKQAKPGRELFAMGCLTQRDGDEVAANIPELDGVFGIGDWSAMLCRLGVSPTAIDRDSPTLFTGHAGPGSAYLRIADGCSHACAFCAIPQMRGLYHSEPMEALLREASLLAQTGIREIMLIGQETTSYGVDLHRERRLVELCKRISDLDGIEWIRILYAHPPSTPPALLDELARVPKLAAYLDFPIEHASNRMLKLMNRRTTAARMQEAIDAFRAVLPDSCVRTTVLVGFPGESAEDFAELYEFMANVRFERAGVFTYSPQAGTPGAELPLRVEEGIALDRLDRLMKLQKQICLERHRSMIGKQIKVIVERSAHGNSWGRSEWDAPEIDGRVRISGVRTPGEMMMTTVRSASAYQLEVEAAVTSTTRGERCGSFALPVLSQP